MPQSPPTPVIASQLPPEEEAKFQELLQVLSDARNSSCLQEVRVALLR